MDTLRRIRFDGMKLRHLRKELGISRRELRSFLEARVGKRVTTRTIQNWESGASSPSANTLAALCEALGAHPEVFFGRRP